MARHCLLVLCPAILLPAACTGQAAPSQSRDSRHDVDVRRVLDWLPADTESIFVANGPFWMSDFRNGGEDTTNRSVTADELEKTFERLILGLFDLKNEFVEKHLARREVLLAVEGSRKFRVPTGLGEMPYEGCELAVFENKLSDARAELLKNAVAEGLRVEEIGGEETVVFQEKMEQDVWTLYVAFVDKNIAAVATDRGYLQEVLARIHGAKGERAFPETLPEWKFVDKTAMFWGLRHFDTRQSVQDPSSPFNGLQATNPADQKAVGLVFQSDPRKAQRATLTYISGDKEGIRKIEESRFPGLSDPVGNAGLHIQYQELEPGVIRSTYDLEQLESVNWFLFVLMGNFGHAVLV